MDYTFIIKVQTIISKVLNRVLSKTIPGKVFSTLHQTALVVKKVLWYKTATFTATPFQGPGKKVTV